MVVNQFTGLDGNENSILEGGSDDEKLLGDNNCKLSWTLLLNGLVI
jgi:hypothetical protein